MVQGQRSWSLASKQVELAVTEMGGQLGPVTFHAGQRKLQPFHVAPWCEEKSARALPPILHALRGDFFCLPFGGNGRPWRGEQHPIHGETANAKWRREAAASCQGTNLLHLSLQTKVRPGRVDKVIFLREGHPVIYCRHALSGFSGPLNPGHHAMLRFPDAPGSGVLSTSRFVYGQVFPGQFEQPEAGGYSSLKAGATFASLRKVPLANGGTADLTSYPARRGFEDLAMIVCDAKLPFAWTAVAFPKERYVWFSLKNPRILRNTVFWLSNGGRHYAPWSGRHVNVMGLEDVTACFHFGLAESAEKNALAKKGFPTVVNLRPQEVFNIPYIMGAVPIPAGFDRVAAVEGEAGAVRLVSASGKAVRVPVALEFLE